MRHSMERLLAFVLSILSIAQAYPLDTQSDTALPYGGCLAVDFLITAFLPKAHATAFCSAYLDLPAETQTSTATAIARASFVTETRKELVPTLTRIATETLWSTATSHLDLWSPRPACSTVPSFDWARPQQRAAVLKPNGILASACRCLDIPLSTTVSAVTTTSSPTSTITKGVVGLVEATSTTTHIAVQTQTSTIFLVPHKVMSEEELFSELDNNQRYIEEEQNSTNEGVARSPRGLFVHEVRSIGPPVVSRHDIRSTQFVLKDIRPQSVYDAI